VVGGLNPSEKYEFVSWDDDIPNIWKNNIHVPNHQQYITSLPVPKRNKESAFVA